MAYLAAARATGAGHRGHLLVPDALERLLPSADLSEHGGELSTVGRSALVSAGRERSIGAARAPAHGGVDADGPAVRADLLHHAALFRAWHRHERHQGLATEDLHPGRFEPTICACNPL